MALKWNLKQHAKTENNISKNATKSVEKPWIFSNYLNKWFYAMQWLWLIHVGIRPHCVRGGGGRPGPVLPVSVARPRPRTEPVSCQSIYPPAPLPCSHAGSLWTNVPTSTQCLEVTIEADILTPTSDDVWLLVWPWRGHSEGVQQCGCGGAQLPSHQARLGHHIIIQS